MNKNLAKAIVGSIGLIGIVTLAYLLNSPNILWSIILLIIFIGELFD